MGGDLRKKLRRKINVYFLCVCSGTVLSFLSIVILATTQTSINIEGDAGAITLSVASIGSIVYSIFVAPVMLKRFGPGINLVLSDISYLLYCLANYSNDLYVLVFGGLMSSLARATLLPASVDCCFQLAEQFYYCGSKSQKFYDGRFQGRLYSIFGSVSIIGNSISFAVLYGTSSANENVLQETTTFSPIFSPTKPANYSRYDYCGVNDCNDPFIVADNIDSYVPPDRRSVYALASSASACVVLGLILHAVGYPGIGRFGSKLKNLKMQTDTIRTQAEPSSKKPSISLITEYHDLGESVNGVQSRREYYEKMDFENLAFEHDTENNNCTMEKHDKKFEQKSLRVDLADEANSDFSDESSIRKEISPLHKETYISTLKSTCLFFLKYQAILLTLSPFKNGMLLGLTFSDVTRAYSSCVAGVEMAGIIAVSFGILGIPAPIIYSWGSARFGRNAMMAVLAVIETSYYVGLYTWVPDPNTIYVVAILFGIGGFTNGMSRTSVTVIYDEYFFDESHIAMTMWNMWVQFGIGLQYALSTFMCVEDKLYLMMATVVAANLSYALAEILKRRSDKKSPSETDTAVLETKF